MSSKAPVQTVLTKELAARLLADPHPKQRRTARQVVRGYARAMVEGRWVLVPDPILVAPDGRMFNGGHRCEAVITSKVDVPVYIQWDADPDLFDVIDIGRRRSPYQFIDDKDPANRAAGARITLWYERRFDRPPIASNLSFDLHEVMVETDRRRAAFDDVTPAVYQLYDYTGLSKAVTLGAFALFHAAGHGEAVHDFASDVADPYDLNEDDPARQVADRFRKKAHSAKRRQTLEDWNILVYALNLRLHGDTVSKLFLRQVWPKVGEPVEVYNRRANAMQKAIIDAATRRKKAS